MTLEPPEQGKHAAVAHGSRRRIFHGRIGRADARPSRGGGTFHHGQQRRRRVSPPYQMIATFFHGHGRRRRVSPPYRMVAYVSTGFLLSLLSFLSLKSLSLSSLKSLLSQPGGRHRHPIPPGTTAHFTTGTDGNEGARRHTAPLFSGQSQREIARWPDEDYIIKKAASHLQP